MIVLTKKNGIQKELHAIHQIVTSLSPLDEATRKRVLDYALTALPLDTQGVQPTVGLVAGGDRPQAPKANFKASPLVNA